MTSHTLDVPGAQLHYDVVGTGPVVALIGLPMTAGGLADLAAALAGDRTVVTYDPRGFGRSTVEDPDSDAEPDLLADDVAAVLRAVTGEPADVFGTSGGAVVGLALATRHPDRVRTLVAHEPPVSYLLPEGDELREQTRAVHETYRSEGAGPAFGAFMALCGFTMPDPGPSAPPPPEPSPQDQADGERMLAHSLLPVNEYRVDVDTLKEAGVRVLVGGGSASGTELPLRSAEALAEALDTGLTLFPGGHVGFLDAMGGDSAAFARRLERVLPS